MDRRRERALPSPTDVTPACELSELSAAHLAPACEHSDCSPTHVAPACELSGCSPTHVAPACELSGCSPTHAAPARELSVYSAAHLAPVRELSNHSPPHLAPVAQLSEDSPTQPAPVAQLSECSPDVHPPSGEHTKHLLHRAFRSPAPREHGSTIDAQEGPFMARPVKATRTRSPVAPRRSVAPRPEPEPDVPEVEGSADAVELFRTRAGQLRLADVLRCHADPHLAYHNVMSARAALLEARAEIDATGFRVDWSRVQSVESLALAVVYTASRVPADPRITGEVRAMLLEARPLRALLLSNAHTLSLIGRCSPAEVARIERGLGFVDAATDLVDLAVLHTDRDLIGTGSAVTAAQVKRAKELGTDLLKKIRPATASRARTRTSDQETMLALRDRLWTLLMQTNEYFERIAGARWGRDLGAHVPRLQARYVAKKRAKKTAEEPVAPK